MFLFAGKIEKVRFNKTLHSGLIMRPHQVFTEALVLVELGQKSSVQLYNWDYESFGDKT